MDNKASFAFLVLAYNHEEYIVEHLESIKYLVETYASCIDVDIIINDDCSRDRTVELIMSWLSVNAYLFRSVVKTFNEVNIGTCASILNMLSHVAADSLKLTAGDDVYSFENIFEFAFLEDDVAFLSGIPVGLIDGKLVEVKSDIFGIVSSQVIYHDKPLIDRFTGLSNNNAPNMIYNKKYLTDDKVKEFLARFDVVEDWPLQIAIAKKFPNTKFELIERVFVYYRRTEGSTYLVAGSRFYKDKCRAYGYLVEIQKSAYRKLVLRNRLFCFISGSSILAKVFNIGFYSFIFSAALRVFEIFRFRRSIDLRLSRHEKHYANINKASRVYK